MYNINHSKFLLSPNQKQIIEETKKNGECFLHSPLWVGKLPTSRRYNQLPLLRSSPGGFARSWPYRTYPYTCIINSNKKSRCSFFCKDRCFFPHRNNYPKKIFLKHINRNTTESFSRYYKEVSVFFSTFA